MSKGSQSHSVWDARLTTLALTRMGLMDEEHRRMGFGEDNRFYFRICELEPLRLCNKGQYLGRRSPEIDVYH